MDNYFSMELMATSQNESFARSTVAAFASGLPATLEQLNDIKTAVSEAVTNCVVHAYTCDKCGIIKITAKLYTNAIEVEISDFGVGIEDVETAVQPFFTTRPQEERSGMGFTIMKTFMDEFDVSSGKGGTTVKMKKYIASEAVSA